MHLTYTAHIARCLALGAKPLTYKQWLYVAGVAVMYPREGISLDILVREFEATPEGARAMAEGRQWVRNTWPTLN